MFPPDWKLYISSVILKTVGLSQLAINKQACSRYKAEEPLSQISYQASDWAG